MIFAGIGGKKEEETLQRQCCKYSKGFIKHCALDLRSQDTLPVLYRLLLRNIPLQK